MNKVTYLSRYITLETAAEHFSGADNFYLALQEGAIVAEGRYLGEDDIAAYEDGSQASYLEDEPQGSDYKEIPRDEWYKGQVNIKDSWLSVQVSTSQAATSFYTYYDIRIRREDFEIFLSNCNVKSGQKISEKIPRKKQVRVHIMPNAVGKAYATLQKRLNRAPNNEELWAHLVKNMRQYGFDDEISSYAKTKEPALAYTGKRGKGILTKKYFQDLVSQFRNEKRTLPAIDL